MEKALHNPDYIGKILIDAGVITQEQLDEALLAQQKTGEALGRILTERRVCSSEEVTSAYALQIGVRYIKLSDFDIEPHVVEKIPVDLALKYKIFPIHIKKDALLLAMADPLDLKVRQGIEFFLNCKVEPVISSEREIAEATRAYYKLPDEDSGSADEDGETDIAWQKEHELKELVKESDDGDRTATPSNMVGRSRVMVELYKNIFKVAKSNATVLLLGESGTGKEVIAEAIHHASSLSGHPFIKASCAALPESLLESELFGHEKGAFTGAFRRRLGRFELANSGTLFLDEIGEISLGIQVKLLRVLQQRKITRLGGTESLPIDVRIIAATNRDLKQAVDEGAFRKDLYYRLNVISFMLPPLRKRKEDIPLLIEHFLAIYNKREHKTIAGIDARVTRIMQQYDWPGNVRELENCVERAVVMAEGRQMTVEHLPYNLQELADAPEASFEPETEPAGALSLDELEKRQITRILGENQWNMNIAAEILGIHRNTLRRKMAQYRIAKPRRGVS